jgi:signal transduction histidine kinase
MPGPAPDADDARGSAVTLGPQDCREVNRWWTIARSVTNVAHDLNNVLQLITGNVEMLQLRSGLDEVASRRLASIATQAQRAVATMAPLLDYARGSSSAIDCADVRALASLALSLRSVSLGRGGVKTCVVPSSGEALVVGIDPGTGLQLLLNLLLRAEREVYGRTAAEIIVDLERRGDVVVAVIEARAEGARAEPARATTIADVLCDRVTADLARSCGAVLNIEQDPQRVRLMLSMPADARAV